MKKIDYHVGLAVDAIKKDKARDELYSKIDLHRLGQWKPSPDMSNLPWISGKNFASTAPADALDAGARTFASLLPNISIAPLADNSNAYEEAEKQETILDWHLKRMNMWGGKTTHWRIMESAMRYCAVAMETEYLPFKYKNEKKDKRLKSLLSGSAFRWTVHLPSTVHSFESKYGMECVTLEKESSFYDLVSEFGEDNPGTIELRDKLWTKRPNMGEMIAKRMKFVPLRLLRH